MKQYIDINKSGTRKLAFDKPGHYIVFFKNISGDMIFDIITPGVILDIYGIYLGKGKSRFKINTFQNHKAPDSTSNLLIKGVFDDSSVFHYRGLIRIEKEAQKSHAYQKNQNLMLSPRVYVDSKPYLEILANDVFCTHGSTTGKINQEQLYYMKTRGIDEKKGKELIVKGFVGEVYEKAEKI